MAWRASRVRPRAPGGSASTKTGTFEPSGNSATTRDLRPNDEQTVRVDSGDHVDDLTHPGDGADLVATIPTTTSSTVSVWRSFARLFGSLFPSRRAVFGLSLIHIFVGREIHSLKRWLWDAQRGAAVPAVSYTHLNSPSRP